MDALLNELENSKSLEGAVKAIWTNAQNWKSKNNPAPVQKVAIDLYKDLSESRVASEGYLNHVRYLFSKAYRKFIGNFEKDSEECVELLYNFIGQNSLPSIRDRIHEYETQKGPVFIARAKLDEYLIAANGNLRKNFPFFDVWYERKKEFLYDYYVKSIKKVLPERGNLVFVEKAIGPNGPMLFRDRLDKQFPKHGIITIKNDNDNFIDFKEKSDDKQFCILYDLILSGHGIKSYVSRILSESDRNFLFNSNIVLYNERSDSNQYIIKDTISLLNKQDYRDILLGHPIQNRRKNTSLENFMWGVGANIGPCNTEMGDKFEHLTRVVMDSVIKRFQSEKV